MKGTLRTGWERASLRRTPREIVLLCCLLGAALSPYTARAEGRLAQAMSYVAASEFEEAIAAFDEVWSTGALASSELATLCAERAIAYDALGKHREVDAQLRYLAALDPNYRFSVRAPVLLVARFLALRAAPSPLVVDTQRLPDGLAIRIPAATRARLTGLKFRIAHRTLGGAWSVEEGVAAVERAGAAPVEYYVEALGPGNVVLAHRGSLEAPVREQSLAVSAVPNDAQLAKERKQRRRRWIAGVAVAATTVAAIVLATTLGGRQQKKTQLNPNVDY